MPRTRRYISAVNHTGCQCFARPVAAAPRAGLTPAGYTLRYLGTAFTFQPANPPGIILGNRQDFVVEGELRGTGDIGLCWGGRRNGTVDDHTDNTGDDKDPKPNQVLSEQRMAAIKAYLVRRGAAAARLQTQALAALAPWPPTIPKPTNVRAGASNSSSPANKSRRREPSTTPPTFWHGWHWRTCASCCVWRIKS